jgi:hypothetical protein
VLEISREFILVDITKLFFLLNGVELIVLFARLYSSINYVAITACLELKKTFLFLKF